MTSPRFPHLPDESWSLYLDDALEGEAAARIERHLDECAACRSALVAADPSRIFGTLRGLPAPEGTWDGFWEELEPQLGEPQLREQPSAARAPRLRRLGLGAGIAAALGLAVLLTTLLTGPQHPPRVAAEPCPETVAALHLTREECRALFGTPLADTEPDVVVVTDVDLRGL